MISLKIFFFNDVDYQLNQNYGIERQIERKILDYGLFFLYDFF